MKRFLLLILAALLVTGTLRAQMVLTDPVTGKTFDTDKYSATRGTPFLFENWLRGSATTSKGIYLNLELKYNAYDNILYFNRDDQPYEFQDPINSFTLVPGDTLYFKKGISGSNLKPNQFVQVLAEGKIGFYKSEYKSISEMSEINAGVVKSFMNITRYYMVKDGRAELVKLNKSDILDYLKDKEEQVKNYMAANNTGAKKEADFVKIIRYYNSLW